MSGPRPPRGARPADTAGPPAVSVVICTYQRPRLLGRCLSGLAAQEEAPAAEVLVVDNAAATETKDVVEEHGHALVPPLSLRYVAEPRVGLSRARNRGVLESRGRFIAFLDDDAVPGPGWLAAIERVFEAHPQAAALGGPIEPDFETRPPTWLRGPVEPYYAILRGGATLVPFPPPGGPVGANMAFRREVLSPTAFAEHLGRRGSSLMSREEKALFDSLRRQGHELLYVPEMKVSHFIAAQRCRRAWLMERAHSEGVSRRLATTAATERSRLYLTTVAKYALVSAASFVADAQTRVLLDAKRASYHGVLFGDRRQG